MIEEGCPLASFPRVGQVQNRLFMNRSLGSFSSHLLVFLPLLMLHYSEDDEGYPGIEYKLILAALIDSEQMLLSTEAQLCTRIECKTFRPRRPSVAMSHTHLVHCN